MDDGQGRRPPLNSFWTSHIAKQVASGDVQFFISNIDTSLALLPVKHEKKSG